MLLQMAGFSFSFSWLNYWIIFHFITSSLFRDLLMDTSVVFISWLLWIILQWTWVSVNSRIWWWTGRPGMLRFMGSQRVGHDWATDLIWSDSWFYHVRLVSGVQQSDSNIYTHNGKESKKNIRIYSHVSLCLYIFVYIPFEILFCYILLQNIEYSSLCYKVLLVVYLLYIY